MLANGISWRTGRAGLRLVGPDGDGERQDLALGAPVGWRIDGPRRCTGVWLPEIGERRPCPNASTIAAATATSQCADCAAADPGRALARNFAIDDPRPFAVYLAWFGDRLVKVGLTAVERGQGRLEEQGALGFTWLARGPFRSARRLEHAIAATGMADERIPRSRKLAAWWQLARPATGAGDQPANATANAPHHELKAATAASDELTAVHRAVTADLAWPEDLDRVDVAPSDLAGLFGLDAPLPAVVDEVTALGDGAILTGRLRVVAGHEAILDTVDGALLLDLRLLAGWRLTPVEPGATTGLVTGPFDPGGGPDQGTLF